VHRYGVIALAVLAAVQRAEEGCGNAAQLFRQISSPGYTGSYSTVRDYFEQHRPGKAPLTPPPPTVREITGWLTRHPDSLTEDEKTQLKALLERCPELHATSLMSGPSHVPHDAHPAHRVGPPAVDQRRPGRRTPRPVVLRQRSRTRHRRRHPGLTSRWNSGAAESRVNLIK
jgi:hypothetical protein